MTAISFLTSDEIAVRRSILLLLSQEGRVVFLVGAECHAMPRGDSFADTGVIILVEFEQINFLASGNVLPENIEPFHAGVTR